MLCISTNGLGMFTKLFRFFELKNRYFGILLKTILTTMNDEFPNDTNGDSRELTIRIDEIRDEVNNQLAKYEENSRIQDLN